MQEKWQIATYSFSFIAAITNIISTADGHVLNVALPSWLPQRQLLQTLSREVYLRMGSHMSDQAEEHEFFSLERSTRTEKQHN